MPIVRRTVSPVSRSIVTSIKGFISQNAEAMSADSEASIDTSAEAIAEAIAYGIAKALNDPSIKSAFTTGGLVPPSGNPLQGQQLHSAIAVVTMEV